MVAMLLAGLVITPLLMFAINIIDTDRQEQAKITSEQEIQSALDYIANDLQEAVYIYDADGITTIKSQLPGSTATDRVPVLVFWKRELKQNVLPVNTSSTCTSANCSDAFVYSLVAYYLIKNNDSTWSNTAHIGKFKISDGVRNPHSSTSTDYLSSYPPSPGFKLFDLTVAGTIKDKMNAWKKDTSTAYTADIVPLVDYIDQSTVSGVPTPVSCTTTSANAQQVPANGTTANPLGIYSFYACVDSSRTLAQVYLRGNALARTSQDTTYRTSQSTYFPTANVQIQGHGFLGAN